MIANIKILIGLNFKQNRKERGNKIKRERDKQR